MILVRLLINWLPVIIAFPVCGMQGQTPAREYLGLTREQIATIYRNLDQHAQYANRIFQRIRVINRELDEEFSRERLDPMAFGVRYLEIETMKREYRERTRAIVAEHRSLLSASQHERLRNLREASRLDEANRQAACLGLDYPSDTNQCGDATESGTIAAANKVERRAEEKLLAIERYLQLTPEQIAGYRANQRSYLASGEGSISFEEWRHHQEFCEALNRPVPDPMQIGAPMVRVLERLHQNHRKRQALVAANRALLRNDQLARLEALVEAEKLAPTLSLAQGHLFVELNHAANEIYFVDGLTATDGTGQLLAGSWRFLNPRMFYVPFRCGA